MKICPWQFDKCHLVCQPPSLFLECHGDDVQKTKKHVCRKLYCCTLQANCWGIIVAKKYKMKKTIQSLKHGGPWQVRLLLLSSHSCNPKTKSSCNQDLVFFTCDYVIIQKIQLCKWGIHCNNVAQMLIILYILLASPIMAKFKPNLYDCRKKSGKILTGNVTSAAATKM